MQFTCMDGFFKVQAAGVRARRRDNDLLEMADEGRVVVHQLVVVPAAEEP